MGHESPIEPWLAADNRAAWESPNRLASSRQSDENRWQKKPTALREASSVRDHRTEGQNNPAQTGWAGSQEKIRPQERCFFLDSFYRTNQDLAARTSSANSRLGFISGSEGRGPGDRRDAHRRWWKGLWKSRMRYRD